MKTRPLGSELSVSAMGLGCVGMSDFYCPRDGAKSISTLHRLEAFLPLGAAAGDRYRPQGMRTVNGRAPA